MPKLRSVDEERKVATKRLESDPGALFVVRTRVPGQTFLQLLDAADASQQHLWEASQAALVDWFVAQQHLILLLNTSTRERLETLATCWACSPSQAASRIIDTHVSDLLEQEMELRDRARQLVKS